MFRRSRTAGGTGPESRSLLEGCLNVAGACSAGAAGCSRSRWAAADDGGGFRAATPAEVDAALRQRELFGAAEYPVQRVNADDGEDVAAG